MSNNNFWYSYNKGRVIVGMSALDVRDMILGSNDMVVKEMTIPEWGDVKIEVRTMTAKARAEMLEKSATETGKVDIVRMYPLLLIACVYDPESGEKVFGPDDESALSGKASGPVERIAQEALKVSGMTPEVQVELGKDLSVPNGDSTSD